MALPFDHELHSSLQLGERAQFRALMQHADNCVNSTKHLIQNLVVVGESERRWHRGGQRVKALIGRSFLWTERQQDILNA